MNRRRFLSISAASLGVGGIALGANRERRWTGRVFGAQAEIILRGDEAQISETLARVELELARLEKLFSLYDPASEISRLNRDQYLEAPSKDMQELIEIADYVHQATLGYFDPTIQPSWLGQTTPNAHWGEFDGNRFHKPNMALTFNGIAQGFATDRVSTILQSAGFPSHLVNMGEYRVQGRRYVLDIQNQYGRKLERIGMREGAIATSSPYAARSVMDAPHILNPLDQNAPQWRTVSAIADHAALADAFSTGLCFSSLDALRYVVDHHDALHALYVEDHQGRIMHLV